MKNRNLLISLLIVFLLIGCTHNKNKTPKVSDSIELKAIKTRNAVGNSYRMSIACYKENNPYNFLFPKIKGIPDSLKNVNIYFCCLDFMQAYYQAYKLGLMGKEDFIKEISKEVNDTINCFPGNVKTFIAIATGVSKKGVKYYLVDTNNNYDFSDEAGYSMDEKINSKQIYKVQFERVTDHKIKIDSTWIGFYEDKAYKVLNMQFYEQTQASFAFDSVQYNLTVSPSDGVSVKYGKNVIYRLENKSLNEMQVFGNNQYAHLKDLYFQVNCSDDGRIIKMQKDTAAWKKGSAQLNMPALPFKAITLKGDTVLFPSDFKGKYVLLDFWSTHCFHCIQDIRDYYLNIYKKYGGKNFEIVGIADNLKNEAESFVIKNGITWTMIPAKQSIIQDIYRVEGYPFLFLINPDGVIISKGEELRKDKINSVLEKYLKPNSQKTN